MAPKTRTNEGFYFSIIMAVYNVEEYLEEAIDSLLNQTLNFKKHVQLILINDGSVDESGKVCEKYQAKYPENIFYISKENEGVSSARNAGLEIASGKYVNFLDPDDMLSKNTLEEVYKFFESKGREMDVVSIPIFWFDQTKGKHILNYKYTSNRVINILSEHQSIQMSSSSSFVLRDAIGDIRFNKTLKYGEDAEWLNRIILKKCEYGVVKNAKYRYRKRSISSSATQQALRDKDYYLHSLLNFSFSLVNMSLEILGFVPKYIQYMLMYDLQWRLNHNELNTLMTEEETEKFLANLRELLSYIDDGIILEQKHLNLFRKNYLLRVKKNQSKKDFYQPFFSPNNAVMMHGDQLMNSLNQSNLAVEYINIENDELIIEGHFLSLFANEQLKLVAYFNDQKAEMKLVDRFYKDVNVFGKNINKAIGFKCRVPLGEMKRALKVSFFAYIKNSKVKLNFGFGSKSFLTDKAHSYYNKNGYLVTFQKKKMQFLVRKNRFKLHLGKEIAMLKMLKKVNKTGSKKAIFVRAYHFLQQRLFTKKTIWLFMDRVNKADDNAEVLFEYAVKQQDGIKKYFVINEDCQDYVRLQKIGKVIPYGSRKHKRYMLTADKLISSHADEFIVNPFGKMKKYYKDLLNFDFIFLQHGITKDDISGWLNKYQKNIRLFITAANKEYDSILHGNYDYEEEEVLLSGFPRFDKLRNENKKRILIMPTWRSDLVAKIDPITGNREYNPIYKESKYFHAFNDLLNNKQLLKAAKEKGYKIVFFPHPNIKQQLQDYQIDESIEVADLDSSYRDNFNQSSLLVTDYSSVAFDFAYLKKPVIYFQFENNHLAEGYFNYQTMGFGDVLPECEQVASRIITYINEDCRMEPTYQERVDQFYQYTDTENCKRVYDAILQISSGKRN